MFSGTCTRPLEDVVVPRPRFGPWRTVAATALTLGALLSAPTSASATTQGNADIWVAAWGSDSAPGTVARPVRGPQRARDLVRTRVAGMTSDLTVHVLPGVYRLTAPLELGAEDSGTGGHRVIWRGLGDAVFSGGRQVIGWHPVPGRPGLFAAHAPAGLDNTRQLYVNGVRAQRARG